MHECDLLGRILKCGSTLQNYLLLLKVLESPVWVVRSLAELDLPSGDFYLHMYLPTYLHGVF